MAAARPNAVASNASAMPGATTARLVVCDLEIPMKLFMMPQTVPNSPTNGAIAPIVASTPVPRVMALPPFASMRSSREALFDSLPVHGAIGKLEFDPGRIDEPTDRATGLRELLRCFSERTHRREA